MNRLQKLFAAKLAFGLVVFTAAASAESLTFDSTVGSSINFQSNGTGASFTFPAAAATPGTDFVVDSSTGFPTNLAGLFGDITGTFSYLNSDINNVAPGIQLVTVSGTGQFILHDGVGNDFTATLVWNNLSDVGSTEGLNYTSSVNLSNFSYSGANASLLALENSSNGSVNVAFSFPAPGESLSGLASSACSAGCSTSFQGTLNATTTPEPTSMAFLLIGGLGIAG